MRVGSPRRRRGVILAIVGALILVVAISTFMLQRVMRQRYLEAHRYTFGEIALHLAESGVNLSIERLRAQSLEPGSPFYEALVEQGFQEVNGYSDVLEAPTLDALAELLGDATVEVRVEFRNFQPFYQDMGLLGVRQDPREKYGELAVVSRATYRGVTRTLVAARQVKVVNVTAPVLSKFTLFLRERQGQELNFLEYDRRRPEAGFSVDGAPARPLLVYNHAEQFPAVVDGRFDSLGTIFEEYEADLGGLVFLGGDEPWKLNLVHGTGAGRYEELFHLRRTRYAIPSGLGGIENEYGLTFGFYDGIFQSAKFGSASGDPGRVPDSTGEIVPEGCAALHLYGDTSQVTPAPVFGPVFRRYVTMRLVDGLWYPYKSRGEFAGLPTPNPFGGDYPAYQRIMARVVVEPYNRSFDYLASNFEAMNVEDRVTAGSTPFLPLPRWEAGVLARVGPALDGDDYFLYPAPGSSSSGSARLMRHGPGGTEDIFRGSLKDIDGALFQDLVTAKATRAAADAAEFRDLFLADAQVTQPGILWQRTGSLELDGLVAERGVMLVVDGSITLKGPVVAEPGEDGVPEPITLVSLRGDIRVETSDRIEAQLVALRGRVVPLGGLEVYGGIAAETLDFRSLVRGDAPRSVTYAAAFDSTDGPRYRTQLQVAMGENVQMYMEGH